MSDPLLAIWHKEPQSRYDRRMASVVYKLLRVSFMLVVLAGCGADDTSSSDPCISQCDLAVSRCEEKPPSAFGTLVQTTTAWRASCPQPPATLPFVVTGRCADGSLFLHRGDFNTTERYYFTPDGDFRSLLTTVDHADSVCFGDRYWPARPTCDVPVVTEVLCGKSPWQANATLLQPTRVPR